MPQVFFEEERLKWLLLFDLRYFEGVFKITARRYFRRTSYLVRRCKSEPKHVTGSVLWEVNADENKVKLLIFCLLVQLLITLMIFWGGGASSTSFLRLALICAEMLYVCSNLLSQLF